MRGQGRFAPAPGTVIASIALVFALAGTSYATVSVIVPRNSVGTAQLKANAVISAKVKNGSLQEADFAAGQIPAGPAGPAGPQGAKGDKGDKGDPGRIGTIVVRSASVSVPGGGVAENGNYDSAHVQRNCDPDEKAISGGTGWSSDADDQELWTGYLLPVPNSAGAVVGFLAAGGNDSGAARTFTVYVLCYKG
jgi:hypothetical protein